MLKTSQRTETQALYGDSAHRRCGVSDHTDSRGEAGSEAKGADQRLSTAALVRVARARLAEQTSDLGRARRELSLAADQLPLDHYLKAALKELLESP